MNKIKKILVISSKGGVGKSTISMQIATPYLYINNDKKPISYYEFDDENQDHLSFKNSDLSVRESIEVSDNFLRDRLADIFSKDEAICVDIGGNKTTTLALKAFRDSGMIDLVDLVIIPLLDGEQDGINASVVYNTLQHIKPNIKVLFILNKVKNKINFEYQFENYFGDPRGLFDTKYALKTYLKDDDFENYAIMLDDDIIKYSRRFGMTIYEISEENKDYVTKLRKNIPNYTHEKETRLICFKTYIDNSSKEYYNTVILPIFNQIDQLI